MNNLSLSNIVDLNIIGILLLAIIVGYFSGFIGRLYNFLCFIFKVICSYLFARPLASLFPIVSNDFIGRNLTKPVNIGIYFLIIYIIFSIIFMIIDLFIKPKLKDYFEEHPVADKINKLLGLSLSFIKSFVLVCLILLLVIKLPLPSKYHNAITESILGSQLVKVFPDVYTKVKDDYEIADKIDNLIKQFNLNNSSEQQDVEKFVSTSVDIIDSMLKYGLLDNEDLNNQYAKIDDKIRNYPSKIKLSSNHYDKLMKILDRLDNNRFNIQEIKDKFVVV